jgi:hypothetical protein
VIIIRTPKLMFQKRRYTHLSVGGFILSKNLPG